MKAGKKLTEGDKKKRREHIKKYRDSHPEYVERQKKEGRERSRRRMLETYNLSEEDFTKLLTSQRNSCAICEMPFTHLTGEKKNQRFVPYVDHDHRTGKVRGLLCHNCNSLLGMARDNQSTISRAGDYLLANGTDNYKASWGGPVTGKIWGITSSLIKNPLVELHKLTILPNSHCSLHKHDYKTNAFIVTKGVLFVDVHKNNYDSVDVTELHIGNVLEVKAGEYHQFRTNNIGAECLEIYYPEALSEDIIRKTIGGKNE